MDPDSSQRGPQLHFQAPDSSCPPSFPGQDFADTLVWLPGHSGLQCRPAKILHALPPEVTCWVTAGPRACTEHSRQGGVVEAVSTPGPRPAAREAINRGRSAAPRKLHPGAPGSARALGEHNLGVGVGRGVGNSFPKTARPHSPQWSAESVALREVWWHPGKKLSLFLLESVEERREGGEGGCPSRPCCN